VAAGEGLRVGVGVAGAIVGSAVAVGVEVVVTVTVGAGVGETPGVAPSGVADELHEPAARATAARMGSNAASLASILEGVLGIVICLLKLPAST
jgi:hypothetical protein